MGEAMLISEAGSKAEKFEAVALSHIDSLYRLALYMSENESDAEDLVQDTYLKAYRFFDKFEEGTNCKAWLLTILRNTFVNNIRRDRKHKHAVPLSEMKEHGVELSVGDDPEDEIFKDLFDDDVTAAMNALPDIYREVVLMADVEGLSYKEIADIVGCPIGTVMSRLFRGRRFLRKKLRSYATYYGYVESCSA